MKRLFTYTAILVLLGVTSCQQGPDLSFADAAIHFSSGGVSTKGYLGSDDLEVTGTRVKVYDAVSGFDGNVNGTSHTADQTFVYLEDEVAYDSGTAYWPYVTPGTEYLWTREGIHRFFGYLSYDKSFNSGNGLATSTFFGSSPSLNPSTLVLTTPAISFTPNTAQYDFLYSGQAVVKDAADRDFSYIPLPLSHLFTAVSLSFNNNADESVTITDLTTVYNDEDLFLHSGYATINYSTSTNGEAIIPEYHLTGDKAHPFFTLASSPFPFIIAPGEKYDLLTGTELTGGMNTETYFLTWPLRKEQISPRNIIGTDVFGNPIYDPGDAILQLTYTMGDNPEVITARVQFPRHDWKAGYRVQTTIDISNKSIEAITETLPWDYTVHEMGFNTESVTLAAGGELHVTTGDPQAISGRVVHLTTAHPEADCRMEFSSLNGATLHVRKIGQDPAYFTVTPSTLSIPAGKAIHVYVTPSELPTGDVERTIQLSFSVELPSGREIECDSQLMHDGLFTFSRK